MSSVFCNLCNRHKLLCYCAARLNAPTAHPMSLGGEAWTGAVTYRTRETSASIAQWQLETFEKPVTSQGLIDHCERAFQTALHDARFIALAKIQDRPNLARALHAAKELAGLITTLANDDNAPPAVEEAASVDIALRGIYTNHHVEHSDVVDATMAKNRARCSNQ